MGRAAALPPTQLASRVSGDGWADTLSHMLGIFASVLLALFVLPAPWGVALVASATVWEALEKAFWFYRTKGIPVAVGPEAMIGSRST